MVRGEVLVCNVGVLAVSNVVVSASGYSVVSWGVIVSGAGVVDFCFDSVIVVGISSCVMSVVSSFVKGGVVVPWEDTVSMSKLVLKVVGRDVLKYLVVKSIIFDVSVS